MKKIAWAASALALAGCVGGGPATQDWTPEQRAAARALGIRLSSIAAQGALASYSEKEWRNVGHAGVGAMTSLALEMNAPETAQSLAEMDPETMEALRREVESRAPERAPIPAPRP